MANTKMREPETVDKTANEVRKKIQREKDLINLNDKHKEITVRLDNLAGEYLDAKEKYGEEHMITKIKFSALKLCSSLSEVLEVVMTVQSVFNDFTMISELMDDAMSFIDNSLDSKISYTLFKRLKMKIRTARYIKNYQNRVRAIFEQVKGITKFSDNVLNVVSKYIDVPSKQGGKKKSGFVPEEGGIDESTLSKDVQDTLARKKAEREGKAAETSVNNDKRGGNGGGKVDGSPDVSGLVG